MLLVVVVPAQLVLPEEPGAPASVARAEHTQEPRAPRASMVRTVLEAVVVVVDLLMQCGVTQVVQVGPVL
jgi:hypothetical protein